VDGKAVESTLGPVDVKSTIVISSLIVGTRTLIAYHTGAPYDALVHLKKLRWYAQLGIPEYWLVGPTARTLERLVMREGAYVIATSVADDEIFSPETFEGLSILLAELWASSRTP